MQAEAFRQSFAPHAMLCSIYANVHRNKDAHPQEFTVEDFIPGAKPAGSRVMSAEEMLMRARTITAMFKSRK